jgi:hypothetical protein
VTRDASPLSCTPTFAPNAARFGRRCSLCPTQNGNTILSLGCSARCCARRVTKAWIDGEGLGLTRRSKQTKEARCVPASAPRSWCCNNQRKRSWMRQCCSCKRGSNCSIQAPEVSPHFSLASRSAMPAVSGSWVTLPPAGFRAARVGSVTTSRPVAVDRDQERAACKRQWTTAIQAGGWAQPSNQ